jgi:hypothetical protein
MTGGGTTAGDEAFHTCGGGGPTGEWSEFEVDYPAGTVFLDQSAVTRAVYEVYAPPSSGPLPLVLSLHGDNGTTGPTKSDWEYLFDDHAFILVLPREPHQQVDGGLSDNGWDNYPSETRGFVANVLQDVGARYDVDIDRIYGAGASAGSWGGAQNYFTMQNTFAAVQLNCGGATSLGYDEPEDPACRTPVRFEIAPSDFLYSAAQSAAMFLQERGNVVEFHDTACDGHCCGEKEDYGGTAWAFFSMHTQCGRLSAPGCGDIPLP